MTSRKRLVFSYCCLALLLAVLFTVFSRVNVKGEPEPLEKRGQALRCLLP